MISLKKNQIQMRHLKIVKVQSMRFAVFIPRDKKDCSRYFQNFTVDSYECRDIFIIGSMLNGALNGFLSNNYNFFLMISWTAPLDRVTIQKWPCNSGTYQKATCPVYTCTVAYTGQAIFYKVPEKHSHVYLVELYAGGGV